MKLRKLKEKKLDIIKIMKINNINISLLIKAFNKYYVLNIYIYLMN